MQTTENRTYKCQPNAEWQNGLQATWDVIRSCSHVEMICNISIGSIDLNVNMDD